MKKGKTGEIHGKNLSYLRATNAGAVIRTLLLSPHVSRLELARRMGLTKMSMTYIVSELMEKGVVRELPSPPPAGGAPGRRPVCLELRGDSLFAVGVYISRDGIHTSLVSLGGAVADGASVPLPAVVTGESLLDCLEVQLRELLSRCGGKRILGIGVASIGMVSISAGEIVTLTGFEKLPCLPVKEWLEERLGLPVYVLNDMKAAAMAELYYGAARELSDFVYVGVTNGIGAGIVFGGKLYEGRDGFSSELGHTCIQRGGPPCFCGGNGCLELYASVPVLLRSAGRDNWASLLEGYRQGDPACRRVLLDFCGDMGDALRSIANVFDPEAVILGHEGASLPEDCFRLLQQRLDSTAITRDIKRVRVRPSALPGRIHQLSAAAGVFYRLFQGRIPL